MYSVEWLDSAINELTALWLAADEAKRTAIRMAVAMVESRWPRLTASSA